MDNKDLNKKVELNDEQLDNVAGGAFAEADAGAIESLYQTLLGKNPDFAEQITFFYNMAKTSPEVYTYDQIYSMLQGIGLNF